MGRGTVEEAPITEEVVYRPDPDPKSWFQDPRPELTEDSPLWRQLLVAAFSRDPDLGMAVYLFRSMGSRLVRARQGYVLRPGEYDASGRWGWMDETEYRAMAERRLAPKTVLLKELLLALRQESRGRKVVAS